VGRALTQQLAGKMMSATHRQAASAIPGRASVFSLFQQFFEHNSVFLLISQDVEKVIFVLFRYVLSTRSAMIFLEPVEGAS